MSNTETMTLFFMDIPAMLKKVKIYTIKNSRISTNIKGLCAYDKNTGNYSIGINGHLNREQKTNAILHELMHIWRNDFIAGNDINTIEAETHKTIAHYSEHLTNDIKKAIRLKLKTATQI